LGVDDGAMKRLFVSVFLKSCATLPQRLILDLDATDDPIHDDKEVSVAQAQPCAR